MGFSIGFEHGQGQGCVPQCRQRLMAAMTDLQVSSGRVRNFFSSRLHMNWVRGAAPGGGLPRKKKLSALQIKSRQNVFHYLECQ